jgi:hypothetical protein
MEYQLLVNMDTNPFVNLAMSAKEAKDSLMAAVAVILQARDGAPPHMEVGTKVNLVWKTQKNTKSPVEMTVFPSQIVEEAKKLRFISPVFGPCNIPLFKVKTEKVAYTPAGHCMIAFVSAHRAVHFTKDSAASLLFWSPDGEDPFAIPPPIGTVDPTPEYEEHAPPAPESDAETQDEPPAPAPEPEAQVETQDEPPAPVATTTTTTTTTAAASEEGYDDYDYTFVPIWDRDRRWLRPAMAASTTTTTTTTTTATPPMSAPVEAAAPVPDQEGKKKKKKKAKLDIPPSEVVDLVSSDDDVDEVFASDDDEEYRAISRILGKKFKGRKRARNPKPLTFVPSV